MLKTIGLYHLIATLIALLVSTPILVATSHDHDFFGGNGHHTIQSHTCGVKELHRELHAGDTCLACLRAGLFVASFPADQLNARIAPIGPTKTTADLPLVQSDDLACPKRGPPICHS